MKSLRNLLLVAAVLSGWNFAFAQTWLPTTAPSNSWFGLASSADGSKWIAVSGTRFYSSTNAGMTWVTNSQTSPSYANFQSTAMSADGSKIAVIAGNACWVSADSGNTWSSNIVDASSLIFLRFVTMSPDGSKLAAVQGRAAFSGTMSGAIYLSTNSGSTWMPTTAPTNIWVSVAISADGSKLAAAVGNDNTTNGNFIYISTNSGTDWILSHAPTNVPWASLASSADGSKMVAGGNFSRIGSGNIQGSVYTSTNSGMDWRLNNVPPAQWLAVASSADGAKLIAVGLSTTTNAATGLIYTSNNSGASWISNSVPNLIWQCVASSADGNKLLAASTWGDPSLSGASSIYACQTIPTPQLNLGVSSTNLALSWTIPSTNFVLQQSPDLISWAAVTNAPMLNLTNLQNQVTLSPSNGSGFYRLKTP
jgi:hypothetical protein